MYKDSTFPTTRDRLADRSLLSPATAGPDKPEACRTSRPARQSTACRIAAEPTVPVENESTSRKDAWFFLSKATDPEPQDGHIRHWFEFSSDWGRK